MRGCHFLKYQNGLLSVGLVLGVIGCAVHFHQGRPSDVKKIGQLQSELARVQEMRQREQEELAKAKALLSKILQKEIDDKQVKVEQSDRGLVITFLAEVLFDSGKVEIRPEAYEVLDKVAKVLNKQLVDYKVGIEGHTDNEPIKHSGWKSNWELSTARATSVLHYLVDEQGTSPKRVSAIGYGEYHPVAPNDTEDGKQQNRRVEVVILPKQISKVRAGLQEMTVPSKPTREEEVSQYIK